MKNDKPLVENTVFVLTIGKMSKFDVNKIIIDNMNGGIYNE